MSWEDDPRHGPRDVEGDSLLFTAGFICVSVAFTMFTIGGFIVLIMEMGFWTALFAVFLIGLFMMIVG